MLRVKTNGFEFLRFERYVIESSLDTLADDFSFTVANPEGVHAGRILPGRVVELFDDNVPLMIGEIDDVSETDSITVKGRDLMIRAIENDVEHQEDESTVHPVKEIKALALQVGITKWDDSGLPPGIKPIESFTREAGESTAEVMIRLANEGRFYLWLDRLGILHLSKYDFKQPAGWDFYNRRDGANCELIARRRSAANLKAEIWAFTEGLEQEVVKHNDQALIRSGFLRRKTLLDNKSETYEQAHRKIEKLLEELKLRANEFEVNYGGPHIRENGIPEPGRTATVTSIYSQVDNLKGLISSVTLKKDHEGTKTTVVVREQP